MIQSGTYLNVIDNSGAKDVCCIKVSKGYRRRYAFIGDVITVSVKSLRSKRKATSKVKKGDVITDEIVSNISRYELRSITINNDSIQKNIEKLSTHFDGVIKTLENRFPTDLSKK